MSTKRQKPVKINNPSSDNHIVRVHPKQDVLVTFQGDKSIAATISGDFLQLERVNDHKFRISQTHDLTPWEEASRLYLGDVKFDFGDDSKIVFLSVVLETERKDSIAIINPRDVGKTKGLKISPTQLVEVILCSDIIEKENVECRILDGEESIKPVLVRHIVTHRGEGHDANWFEGSQVMRRCFRLEEPQFEGLDREHHYWFRFSVGCLSVFNKLKEGQYNGGRLIFDIVSDDASQKFLSAYAVDLSVSVKEKKAKSLIEPTEADIRQFGSTRKEPVVHRRGQQQTHTQATYVGFAEDEYVPRKVVLEPKIGADLEDGCKVVLMKDFVPTPEKKFESQFVGNYNYRQQTTYTSKQKRGKRWDGTKWVDIPTVNDFAGYDDCFGG